MTQDMLEKVHPDCRNFVAVVDDLLKRRQEELAKSGHPQTRFDGEWGPRTWTQTEMEDMVYSSYKQMRRGRITRPPKRAILMDIADYLNCNLIERNRLLESALYAPIDVYLTGDRLQEHLQPTIRVAQLLDIPAMVINRDWQIHFMNEQMIVLNDVQPEALEGVPPEHFNALRLLFDPNLPLYPNLIENKASWTRMARQTLYGFKVANRLCRFELWYQALIEEWMNLPDFEYHWQTVRTDIPFEEDISARNESSALLLNTAIPSQQEDHKRTWLRPLIISAGYFQFDFPQIVAFLPADEDAYGALLQIGAVTGHFVP